jgi:hypothetical protein
MTLEDDRGGLMALEYRYCWCQPCRDRVYCDRCSEAGEVDFVEWVRDREFASGNPTNDPLLAIMVKVSASRHISDHMILTLAQWDALPRRRPKDQSKEMQPNHFIPDGFHLERLRRRGPKGLRFDSSALRQ